MLRIPTIVSSIFLAISNFFAYLLGRSNANQAKREAEKAKEDQEATDKANQAIQERNIDEIRNGLAE